MTQEQIKEQAEEYIKNNLNCETTLKLVIDILDDISNTIRYDVATDNDKKQFNTLTTIITNLQDMIK